MKKIVASAIAVGVLFTGCFSSSPSKSEIMECVYGEVGIGDTMKVEKMFMKFDIRLDKFDVTNIVENGENQYNVFATVGVTNVTKIKKGKVINQAVESKNKYLFMKGSNGWTCEVISTQAQ